MRIWPAILITLVACKDRDVERLTDIKREVCACKDTRCAEQAMSRVPKASIKSTSHIQAIARDIMDCRARLEAGERPSTDPDAEGSSEGSTEGNTEGSGEGSTKDSSEDRAAPAPAAGSAGSMPAPARPKAAP